GGRINDEISMIQTSFNGELSFLDRMIRFNADYSIRRETQNYDRFQTKYKIGFGPNDVREEGTNNAYRWAGYENYSVLNAYATFEKSLGKHALNAVVGYNQEYSKTEWFSASKDKIISASLPTIALATGEAVVDEGITDWAVRGAFYRLNYIFDNKYIVELNGRYDGSSKFPKDDRFGFFPSASAAWRVDKENFWGSLGNTIDLFKIRGSYGSLGNQFVSEYGYIATMNANRGSYLIDGTLPQIVSSPPLVSANYTWEEVSTRNLGVDLGFLQRRVTLSFDLYNRATKGMLTQGRDLPDVLGAAEPKENAADLETKGWELSLGFENEFTVAGKPLRLTSSFILSDSRSYITKFDNPNRSLTQYYEGMELGEIWGLKSDGLFQTEEEIADLDQSSIVPWGALSVVPGWPRYVDLDNNGAIEKGLTVDDPKDLSVIGNITPRMRFGINLGAEWNGFDFRVFLQGVGKMDFYPLHYLYWGFYQQPYAGGYQHLTDFYRATSESDIDRAKHSQSYLDAGLADENTDAYFPVLQAWLADRNLGERVDESQGLAIPQTRYMQDASYLRLKNITVGYTLHAGVLGRVGISKLRIYVSGENLTEWSKIKNYFDPEAITDNVSKLDPSLSSANGWGYAYPFQRRYSFGIDVQF
ncbi:MAG: SusC/RagA family TonB-linked outer membrane protein, partial [Bacteroidia bacterium]|nr:SusC/RagA family TonB-linked outer membrane protein [Bacteroidia bacterium]